MSKTKRVISMFSCGAASAVATKLAITMTDGTPFEILNNYVAEEHSDNLRFKADCENWFGLKIKTTLNEKYEGSIYKVFESVRFLKNRNGAPCTRLLKRELRDKELRDGDRVVIGFTSEETDRLQNFIDANPNIDVWAPLIELNISKSDCYSILIKAGIELPEMYKLGYNNNNCIGCVKGGMGYWNKIRIDFPDNFERMAKVQDLLGEGSYLFKGKDKNSPRISLRQLKPEQGHFPSEPEISCGVICEHLDYVFKQGDAE